MLGGFGKLTGSHMAGVEEARGECGRDRARRAAEGSQTDRWNFNVFGFLLLVK